MYMCVCLYIYFFSFFSLLFNDRIYFIQKVCELIVNLWNDTGIDHTGGSDICMALCIINFNSLLIIPSCTRKRSLSCHHQWLVCYLCERPVSILLSFIKKQIKCQLVRFYFRILPRTIKPQNEIEYENKFWKVELDSCLY